MIIDKVAGIIGWPVSHSLSPAMHNSSFLACGLEGWVYVPMPVPKYPYIRLKEAVLGLRALGFRGANVTVPYKETVLPYMDDVSESARAIGAVNTIAIDTALRLCGHNTDGQGFINDLRERKIITSSMNVLMLGAGGSARAIAYGLLEHGCRSLMILNRTKSKAEELVQHMRSLFSTTPLEAAALNINKLRELPRFDLIINCTSLGMSDSAEALPWDASLAFSKGQIVYDVIYKPAMTPLLHQAASDGAVAINGLGMLVHQGALSFSIWTGKDAPLAVMKKAVGF